MTASRSRGLLRLGALLVVAAALAVALALAETEGSSGGDSTVGAGALQGRQNQPERGRARGLRLSVRQLALRLPAPISGEAVLADGEGLLVIGGLDSRDVSTAAVERVFPAAGKVRPAGSLAQPLHDLAAAPAGGQPLVFGGGSATTIDQVELLLRDGTARPVGHLPSSRSDLSAVATGGAAYVLGGYDGTTTVAPVLRTRDGRSFTEIARLPVPVRYAAVVARGAKIYVLGGELADGTDSNVIQRVDLAKGTATVAGHLPGGLSHSSAVEPGDRIYLLGGRLAGSTTDEILRFDPATLRAEAVGRLPEPIQNAAAVSIGPSGYLVGGLTPQGRALSTIVETRLVPGHP